MLSWFSGLNTFPRGIHPRENKEATEHKATRRMPFPDEMIIPLSQHTGAPARPIVHEGQEVVRGEPIAEASAFISVPMHAPATGVIREIGLARDARGGMSRAIFLKPYPGASQEILYGGEADIDRIPPEEIAKAVQDTGVVGLGGAAFPTHVKFAVPQGKSIDTVLVNGCECEPYLTTDHRVMLEQPEYIMAGARIARRALHAEQVIIGVESNKMDAVEVLRRHIPKGEPFSVAVCETKYPQGAEKMLIKSTLHREVPSGGLPSECGVAVFNVATLAQIGDLLPKCQGLIERVVTITGNGVTKPGNYLIPLGTPLRYALDYCGYKGDEVTQVILGGPMMGVTVGSVDIPFTKGITGVLALTREGLPSVDGKQVYPCIKCGTCVDSCPMHLNPSQLGLLARKREYARMADQFHLMDCFECGSCAYVCPSSIPLVQYFRIAKAINRERKA